MIFDLRKATPKAVFFLALASVSVASANEIRVGVSDVTPLSYIDDNGQPRGLAIEVLENLAAQNGLILSFKPCEWHACLEELANGKLDLLPVVAKSPDRLDRYDFASEPFFTTWAEILSVGTLEHKSFLDLSRLSIGVYDKSIHANRFEFLAKQFELNVRMVPFDSYESIAKATVEGRLDAGVFSRSFSEVNADEFELQKSGIVFNPVSLHFATLKGRLPEVLTRLSESLKRQKANPSSAYHNSIATLLGKSYGQKWCFDTWIKRRPDRPQSPQHRL